MRLFCLRREAGLRRVPGDAVMEQNVRMKKRGYHIFVIRIEQMECR
jgi:hypothetical protein